MSTVIELEIEKIQVPDLRVTSQVEDAMFDELVESIRKNGILQPITVSNSGGSLILVDGLHRLLAAKQIGLLTVPAIITDDSEADIMVKNLFLNRQRGRSNPAQEAEVVRFLEQDQHLSLREIAERTGISDTRVRQLLAISSLPREVLDLVAERKLGISHAEELLKLEKSEDQLQVAQDAVNWKYTVDQVRLRVHELLNPLPTPQPGSFVFDNSGQPVRVPILCALCAKDLGNDKSYLWLCGDCIVLVADVKRHLEPPSISASAESTPAPRRRFIMDDCGRWDGA